MEICLVFKSDFKKSIRYKFLKDISIILFTSTCVLSILIAVNVGTALDNALMDKSRSYATNIAKRNENALIMSGNTQLSTVYSELITDEEIIYTIIENSEGKLLTNQFESINYKWPGLRDVLPLLSKESELSDIISIIKKQVIVTEVSVPIRIGRDVMGQVTIGMSKQNINLQILRTALFVIALNLMVAVILGAVLFITSRTTIMDPIIELGNAAARLAKGNLDTRVEINSTGEIQKLVSSFNRMAADLERTTVSKDYVDNIINSMLDTLFVVSGDGTIILANQAACSLLGYGRNELAGQPISRVLGGEAPATEMMARIFRGITVSDIEINYLTEKGAEIPMLFSGSLMRDSGGRLVGAVCAATDITARKKIEEALRESGERLDATLQASPAAIMTLSPDGIVTMWNETAERIFGWSREEITGKFDPMVQDADLEGFQHMRQRVLRGESFFGEESGRKRKDGSIAIASISMAPLHDASGSISSIMAVMSDITDRKKMEGELQRIQKLESIGILAGGIAHDFNNILAAVLGNISLTKISLGPDHKLFERLAMAEKACLRATDLTRQLLTFSRGGAPIKKTIAISEMIMESAQFALPGANVKCKFSLAGDLWPVDADEGQLGQVLRNLVLNADQAMPQGGIVDISAENIVIGPGSDAQLQEGKYIKLRIADGGEGIPHDQLRKIFDPYFTTKQHGSGLGLAIAHAIVNNHGGNITVASVVGEGTVFTVLLPAAGTKVTEEKPEADAPVYGKGRILIMDDDEMLRDVAGEMLTSIGYEVGFAADGLEAIQSYVRAREEARPFDAVIMDLTIPGGMGGREAIRKIIEIDPDVNAIVSSGYSQDAIMANYRDYGFAAVIIKPYRLTELGDVLHGVLSGNSPKDP
jgi:PAS domain S-box-containing protein